MKLKYILYTFSAISLAIVVSSSSGGRAAQFDEDRTGSPIAVNQGYCNACHGGGGMSPSISYSLKDAQNMEVTSYFPDSIYTLSLDLGGTAAEYGVQAVMLTVANAQAGTLTAPNSASKISTANGRKYLEHKSNQSTSHFEVSWTAPAVGTGDVKLYAAGILANNSSSTSGDNAVKLPAMTFTEASAVSIEDGIELNSSVFPNPASSFVTVSLNAAVSSLSDVHIYSLDGKLVSVKPQSIKPGLSQHTISVEDLEPGLYLLAIVVNGETMSVNKLFVK